MNFSQSASQCPTARHVAAAPSSPETPSSQRLTAPGVSSGRMTEKILSEIFLDFPVQNITVWTRDHDWTKKDGEVSHAVCRKTEHPEYGKKTRHDRDIAVLHLCRPLMFTEG